MGSTRCTPTTPRRVVGSRGVVVLFAFEVVGVGLGVEVGAVGAERRNMA